MSVSRLDVSRARHELPRLDRMVAPRWLRQRRQARARAARPDALAAALADEIARHNLPGRELTLDELIRAQGVRPLDWEEHKRRRSLLTSEEWAQLRAALAQARHQ